MSVSTAEKLLQDLAFASPAINTLVASYKGPEEQPFVGTLVNEVYAQLEAADQDEATERRRLQDVTQDADSQAPKKKLNVLDLASNLATMDNFSQLLSDFSTLMEAKFGDLNEGNFPELTSATAI